MATVDVLEVAGDSGSPPTLDILELWASVPVSPATLDILELSATVPIGLVNIDILSVSASVPAFPTVDILEVRASNPKTDFYRRVRVGNSWVPATRWVRSAAHVWGQP